MPSTVASLWMPCHLRRGISALGAPPLGPHISSPHTVCSIIRSIAVHSSTHCHNRLSHKIVVCQAGCSILSYVLLSDAPKGTIQGVINDGSGSAMGTYAFQIEDAIHVQLLVEDYQARNLTEKMHELGESHVTPVHSQVPQMVGISPARLSFETAQNKRIPISFDLHGRPLKDGDNNGIKRVITDMDTIMSYLETNVSEDMAFVSPSICTEEQLDLADQVCNMQSMSAAAAMVLLVWKRIVSRWHFAVWASQRSPCGRVSTMDVWQTAFHTRLQGDNVSENIGFPDFWRWYTGVGCAIVLQRSSMLLWSMGRWKLVWHAERLLRSAQASNCETQKELEQISEQQALMEAEYRLKLQSLKDKILLARKNGRVSAGSSPQSVDGLRSPLSVDALDGLRSPTMLSTGGHQTIII